MHKPHAPISEPKSEQAQESGWMEERWLHLAPQGGPQSHAIAIQHGEPVCAGMKKCSTLQQELVAFTSQGQELVDVEARELDVVSRSLLCARKEQNCQHMELRTRSWDAVVEGMIAKLKLNADISFIR